MGVSANELFVNALRHATIAGALRSDAKRFPDSPTLLSKAEEHREISNGLVETWCEHVLGGESA